MDGQNPHLSQLEQDLLQSGVRHLAGVDEVGRGCLAGPVVAACIIFPVSDGPFPSRIFPKVADSKILSPKRREELSRLICERALAWAIAKVEPQEIDSLNIHHASLEVMRQAVWNLPLSPDYVLVDGRFALDLTIPQQAVIDGDAKCQVIAAASIVAKVWRDQLMVKMQGSFPNFSFAQHKGYATWRHREELRRHGPTPIHRRSFKGVENTKSEFQNAKQIRNSNIK